MEIRNIAYCHPNNREAGVAAQLFYDDTALIINPFTPPGKIYVLPRSSHIGPLIEETWSL